MKKITLPLTKSIIDGLKQGEEVLLTGKLWTARDAAHKRLVKDIENGPAPVSLKGEVIYYCGPTPAPRNKVIGSCGPTTSSRMDRFTPALLKAGLKGMIGKGKRGKEAEKAIHRYRAVYFTAIGGIGALLAQKVVSCRVAAYKDLGTEAIHELYVKDFPVRVGTQFQPPRLKSF